jgi:hypothetical protein
VREAMTIATGGVVPEGAETVDDDVGDGEVEHGAGFVGARIALLSSKLAG